MQFINCKESIQNALNSKQAVVALESTLITHGLPYPLNRDTAIAMEEEVQKAGAVPATICIIDGKIQVGIGSEQMEYIAQAKEAVKVSRRDLAAALVAKKNAGTTVSGTMEIASRVGIQVFATGGIGGVHRGNPQDISADLPTLAQIPMIIVCAGAKAILDLPGTREYLETIGVPVIGYKTDELPAFYSTSSGLPVDYRADSAAEVAQIAKTHWDFGLTSAVLLTVPPPPELAIPADEIEESILEALEDAKKNNITGSKVTPFLLAKVSEHSKERSLRVNIALLKNNAHVGGLVAKEFIRLTSES